MKLEHLIQAYNFNNISATIDKEIQQDKERAGVIKFYNGIAASYLLDKEDIVVSIKIIANPIPSLPDNKIDNYLNYVIQMIKVMQKTIELIANIPQKESNMILDKLGLFDNTFKENKKIKHLEYMYAIEVLSGLICLSIQEKEEIE